MRAWQYGAAHVGKRDRAHKVRDRVKKCASSQPPCFVLSWPRTLPDVQSKHPGLPPDTPCQIAYLI
jgi:hypothetical protein